MCVAQIIDEILMFVIFSNNLSIFERSQPPLLYFWMSMESERKASRVALPQKDLSVAELASVLNVLAK